MIVLAALFLPLVWAAMAVLLALPGGLFLMLLMQTLHDHVDPAVPTFGYWVAVQIALLASASAAFIFPRGTASSSS